MSLASEYEQIIRHNRLPTLEGHFQGEAFILPHYGGFSIANLPATVVRLFGREHEGPLVQADLEPALPRNAWSDLAGDVRCVVTVILDAVGYLDFQRLLAAEDGVFS